MPTSQQDSIAHQPQTIPASPDFLTEAQALGEELREFRRLLHRHPELGNDLPWTQAQVLTQLEGLGLEITTGTSLSSVTAVLRGLAAPTTSPAHNLPESTPERSSGSTAPADPTPQRPAVLLRADMDALPVREESGEDFASDNGAMHACGHDLHTAGLIGAARLLAAHRETLAGDVVLMFQPGEENPGGAKPMIDEGVLDAAGPRVQAAFGFHVHPGTLGSIQYRPGTYMAGVYILRITVHGVGGHSSQPHHARNPLPAAVEIAAGLQTAVHQTFPGTEPVVATLTQLHVGGPAPNIITDEAVLGGSVRVMNREVARRFGAMVEQLAAGTAAAHGCTATVDFTELYPATICDPTEAEFAADTLRSLLGEDKVTRNAHSRMGSEDFSYVLDQVPGAFLHVGATYEGLDPETTASNHSARARFDDSVLPVMSAGLARLAYDRLQRG